MSHHVTNLMSITFTSHLSSFSNLINILNELLAESFLIVLHTAFDL